MKCFCRLLLSALAMCGLPAVLFLASASPASAGPPYFVGAAEADTEFSRITAADMAVIRGKHVLMGSRSFGLNCMDGLSRVAATNPMYALNRGSSIDVNNLGPAALPLNVFDNYDFVHYLCTLNPSWTTRLYEMDNFVRSRYHDTLDAIVLFWDGETPDDFAEWCDVQDAIRRDFPQIKVIYVTGRPHPTSTSDPENISASQFSDLVRARYTGLQPLYDIYNLLSTHADGTSAGTMMCLEFNINGDLTHPNAPFAEERLGRAMLLMLYKVFCEPPLQAHAGGDQTVTDTDGSGGELVTLNGSQSFSRDSTIVSYVWKEGGTEIASGINPQVALAVGTHTIRLTVTDAAGGAANDELLVVVAADRLVKSFQIAASNDDCAANSGSTGSTSSVAYCPYTNDTRRAFFRWLISDIPAGSQILEAHLKLTSDGGNGAGTPVLEMRLVDYDSCPAFTTAANPFAGPVNANAVTWVIQGTWLDGVSYSSPDLKSIVQEFLDRPGYAPGTRYLGLRGMGVGNAWKKSYSYDSGSHSNGAVLEVAYAPPVPNLAPTAAVVDLGTVHDTDRSGGETVTLDGRGSTDSDGVIVSYAWHEGATPLGTGPMPQVTLATGLHSITLTVTDDDEATASATVVVEVNAVPVADAGPDQLVDDLDGDGLATVTLNGGGSSDADGYLVDWQWREGPAVLAEGGVAQPQVQLALGVHEITLTTIDQNGGLAIDTVTITVQGALRIEAGLSQPWVFQNTPATTGNRHQVALTVAVSGAAAYTVEVRKLSGPGAIVIAGSDLAWTLSGAARSDGAAGTGDCLLRVTVTVAATQQSATAELGLTVRQLGDLDGQGGVSGQDKLLMNKRLNGLVPDGREFDLDGLGGANGQDKLILNKILNGHPIP